ncbi:MAG: PilX N-terminal domain-containing pilus assembly protein [Dissulfurispiraceae bacterium]|jgi:Tfp pilus assembly protein PilX|nr:PilX N-terminal domain-containing pilus assembly protein [Dissulfurispiraceae bacterium]
MSFIYINTRSGFAMIAALLALLILTAVGVIVFTSTTRDMRIAGRVVGEKKAFAAAEAGLHDLLSNSNFSASITANNIQVDALTDPGSVYSYTVAPVAESCDSEPGNNIEKWSRPIFWTTISGINTRYDSRVDIETGIGVRQSGTCSKTE